MSESQQILRQWKMLQLLADSKVGYTFQELADIFEVSLRSIQRDIAVLQMSGFPLEDVTGTRNLKRWKMKPFTELLQFNYVDLISVMLSRRFLEPLAGSPFWEGHQRIYNKVRGALSENTLKFCNSLQDMIRVSGFAASDYSRRSGILDTLIQAMQEEKRVLVVYQSMQATEPVEQELGPQGLIWHNGSLYLIAWSVRREEIRNYKVDRIEEATIGSNLTYAVPADFSLEDWHKKAFGVFRADGSESWNVQIHFHRDAARYVQESWWHDSQKFDPHKDGSVTMSLALTELTAVMKWVLGFGQNATILAPPELVDLATRELQTLLDRYRQPVPVAESIAMPASAISVPSSRRSRLRRENS